MYRTGSGNSGPQLTGIHTCKLWGFRSARANPFQPTTLYSEALSLPRLPSRLPSHESRRPFSAARREFSIEVTRTKKNRHYERVFAANAQLKKS